MENKVVEERGRWPGTLLLILEHSEEVSLSISSLSLLHTHTDTHTFTHSARLAHEGAVAIKPAQHGAQIERETERRREDSTLHEQYPWKTEMRRERGSDG